MKKIVTLGILCIMAISLMAMAAFANNGAIVFRVVLLDPIGVPLAPGHYEAESDDPVRMAGVGQDGKATFVADPEMCDNIDNPVDVTVDEGVTRCDYRIEPDEICSGENGIIDIQLVRQCRQAPR